VLLMIDLPPKVVPPTPTGLSLPPGTDTPIASRAAYTLPHRCPGPIDTRLPSAEGRIQFNAVRSIVTPSSMFAIPAIAPCPPLRTANLQALGTSTRSALETSSAEVAAKTHEGLISCSCWDQYEFTEDSYAVLFGYSTLEPRVLVKA
jgi:hypothetical protein